MLHETLEDAVLDELGEDLDIRSIFLTGAGVLAFLKLLAIGSIGAVGCVDGPPCAAPERWVDIWNAYQDGDLKRAEAAQARAVEIFALFEEFDYSSCIKALLSHRLGIDCGDPRPPAAPLTDEQKANLGKRAKELGLEPVSVAA